jgi:hypothetical protein
MDKLPYLGDVEVDADEAALAVRIDKRSTYYNELLVTSRSDAQEWRTIARNTE